MIRHLRAIIDGEPDARLTVEQAKELHTQLWDLRGDVARLDARYVAMDNLRTALNDENNRLVAQVLAEERRAVRAEILRAEAVELIRDGTNEISNPKRWRERARKWLASST